MQITHICLLINTMFYSSRDDYALPPITSNWNKILLLQVLMSCYNPKYKYTYCVITNPNPSSSSALTLNITPLVSFIAFHWQQTTNTINTTIQKKYRR